MDYNEKIDGPLPESELSDSLENPEMGGLLEGNLPNEGRDQ